LSTRTDSSRSETRRADAAHEAAPLVGYRFWLRSRDQVAVAVLLVIALALLGVHWLRMSGWGSEPIEIDRLPQHELDYRIDVNTANWVEWCQLPGIGEMLARRIVDDRDTQGPFQSIDDLERVPGIGPKTIDAIRQYLKPVVPHEPASDVPSQAEKEPSAS
jgi:competence protein ComEA